MGSKWWEKAAEIGSAAAQGMASGGGVGAGIAVTGSLLKKRKKKNNLTGTKHESMGADPGGETEDMKPYVYGQEDW